MPTTNKAYCPPFKLQTTLNFLGMDCVVTDLSHTISNEDPTFIGHQRTLIWEHLSHEETQKIGLTKPPYSYKVVGFTMCDHSNTHVDAINHIVDEPDARAINQLPLEWFMAPGVWFDFSHKEPNSYITKPTSKRRFKRPESLSSRNRLFCAIRGGIKNGVSLLNISAIIRE